MHFSVSTLAILSSLIQAQAQVHRIVGGNNAAQGPSIVTPAGMKTLEDPTDPEDPSDPANPELRIVGVFTSFSVIEGTGCPAGTFTPQPIEAGKTINTYVDFESFLFNSTTSEVPVTCSLRFEYDFTYPERGYGVVYPQVNTETESKYEEDDMERGTNFNLEHIFNIKAGQMQFNDVSVSTDLQVLSC
jgi:hypothetical protein